MTGGQRRRRLLRLAAPVDQLLSSGTNFATAWVAARLLSLEQFGDVVVTLSLAYVALAAGRAVVGEPLLVHATAYAGDSRRDARAAASWLGVAAAACCLLAHAVAPAALPLLLWLVPWLPVLLCQDALRYHAFATGRPGRALALDAVWAVVQAALVALLVAVGRPSAGLLITAWGVGALVSVLAVRSRPVPAVGGGARTWFSQATQLAGWLTATAVVAHLHVQAVLWVVASALGSAGVGGLRAVQLLVITPTTAVGTVYASLVVPRMSAQVGARDAAALRSSVRSGVLLMLGVGGAVVAAVALPAQVLVTTVYGEDFARYGALVLPLALASLCQLLSVSFGCATRALRRGHGVFVSQSAGTATAVPLVWAAAETGGLTAVGWAVLAGSAVLCATSLVVYRRALHHLDPPRPLDPKEPDSHAALRADPVVPSGEVAT